MLFLRVSVVLLLYATNVFGDSDCKWDSGDLAMNLLLNPLSSSPLDGEGDVGVSQCIEQCCSRDDCQLALITPDSQPKCVLYTCLQDGNDVCALTSSSKPSAYKKQMVSLGVEDRNLTPTPSNSTDRCRYQPDVGFCRAAFPRFYYDITSQMCRNFTYGGCAGNDNRFESLEECNAACSGVTGDVIVSSKTFPKRRMAGPEEIKDSSPKASLPEMTSDEFAAKCQAGPDVGPCRASMPRYLYNSGTCQRFIFGGCQGNENNYMSEEECMKTCTVKIVDSKKEDEQEDFDYQEFCAAPSDSGPCRASFPMFFFEPDTQSCLRFTYGGCKGNNNRYSTEEECMSKCTGGKYGHNRHRWTPAFFLVATLAIISVVLLIGLLLISSRKTRHQLIFTLDDKQELLPEEYLPAVDPPKPVSH
ncbi:kunitz-type protease inhibitor 2 [Hoplias malabaricus]|uniref:kunitz-type protease inhibitor 2 n=1 Tax=Hoplias malabaricus TaxID=27720 RepID=UPI00346242C0